MPASNSPTRPVVLMYVQRMIYKRPFEYLGNLGVLTIAAYLKSRGYLPKVFTGITTDALALYRRESTAGELPAVGLYCDYDNESAVISLSALLKREYGVRVIIGGPQAFHLGADFLKASACDALVRGDGEETMAELLDYYFSGTGRLDDIRGISYLSPDGTYVTTAERPLNTALDSLPLPDSSLLVVKKRYNLPVASARGCPYRCAFCFEGKNTKTLRLRSVGNVMAEIRHGLAEDPEIRYLWFIDDTFTTSRKRTVEFCKELSRLRENRDFIWFCEGHPGFLAGASDLITTMVEAGMVRMQIGLEAGWNEALRLYEKQSSIKDIRNVIDVCWKAGLPQLAGNFIIGGVNETADTLAATKAFAEELIRNYPGLLDLSTTFIIPLPNTAISNTPEKYGLALLDGRSFTSLEDFPVTETAALNRFDLCKARHGFLKEMLDTMREVFTAGKIPFERIRKHFELAIHCGVASVWYKLVYTKDPLVRDYFTLLVTTSAERLEDISRNELDSWYPCRVFDDLLVVEWPEEGEPIIGGVPLTPLAREMLRLCSGRHNLKSIRDQLAERLQGCAGKKHSADQIHKILEDFARQRWIVFYPE